MTPIVRQALQRDRVQILDWRVSQLGGGAGNPVSAGLYRFAGSAQDRDQRVAWSVILKTIQSPANVGWENMGEGDDQTHWNYWRRELLVYRSDLLTALPVGLTAPRCYGTAELPGDVAWLWLEDVADDNEDAWSLERYALAARHLGRLNGVYLAGRPLPDVPWLSMQRTRQWFAMGPLWETIPWDHPLVRQRYPRPAANTFRRLLFENERFLARLDLLPRTLCHGDTYPTNFKLRRLDDGQEQTVALDWALVGIESVGDDLGQFIYGTQMSLKDTAPDAVDATLFEGYLDGLLDSGYHPDRQMLRFAVTTSAAIRVGLFQLIMLDGALKQNGTDVASGSGQPAAADCFEVVKAKEAYQLLEAI
ncbi:MAG TPA: hypothetical protein VL334_08740 [Anaerolineae bacterium]|nr:hypothetical protein [Anaerolineae bacterium]